MKHIEKMEKYVVIKNCVTKHLMINSFFHRPSLGFRMKPPVHTWPWRSGPASSPVSPPARLLPLAHLPTSHRGCVSAP